MMIFDLPVYAILVSIIFIIIVILYLIFVITENFVVFKFHRETLESFLFSVLLLISIVCMGVFI